MILFLNVRQDMNYMLRQNKLELPLPLVQAPQRTPWQHLTVLETGWKLVEVAHNAMEKYPSVGTVVLHLARI